MSAHGSLFIDPLDLGMAYRKAKADLFYSARACKRELSAFESKLGENLRTIMDSLEKGESPSVAGKTWTIVPKQIDESAPETELINSDPQHLWKTIHAKAQKEDKKVKAEFRLMEKLPLGFHVFAALWINKVGHKFEEKLSESSRGNRLRREKSGKLNLLSIGSTMPYPHAYRKWRDDAFDVMEKALVDKKSIVALTADVSSFYHNLDVRFMLCSSFMEKIGVHLNENEHGLHELFINALHQWAQNTPLERGLPVGLVASSVIANVALFELDRLVEQQIVPLYYGRYVDDIILVMENGPCFKSGKDVWDWMIPRMNGSLAWEGDEKKEMIYHQQYLDGSDVLFANAKNKTFLLQGSCGQGVLKSIRHEVQARTSEWRSMPDLPSDPSHLESVFLSAIQKDGISADSLRKADKVSVRRADFALKLRDIEAYSRAVPDQEWQAQRHAFLSAFLRHVMVLPTFFDFFTYLPRILSLAIHCGDFNHLKQMLDALELILKQLEDCDCIIKAQKKNNCKNSLTTFKENLKVIINEAVESSFPLRLSREAKQLWYETFAKPHCLMESISISELQNQHKRYVCRDLAYRPLKQYLLPPALSGVARHPMRKKDLPNVIAKRRSPVLQECILAGCHLIAGLAQLPASGKLPSGLLFPVRPLGIHDLYLLHQDAFTDQGRNDIASALLAMRGFKPESGLPVRGEKPHAPIEIHYEQKTEKATHIAVASWKTEQESWTASASQTIDPDNNRMDRLNRLLNQVMRSGNKPRYLVFPELSIPPHWFLAIAGKLQGQGISLICGIEYLHAQRKRVHNQVWAALSHDALGFPATMIYRQDKQRPAPHEEQELTRVCGKALKPQLNPWNIPPIINHGGFQFALLICSELTNIAYRTHLRGKVDALFVPEWNRDTESFNALVESAALDIHAYVIQCNDRKYGDSRIRAPYKDGWLRDIVRVKGGIEDYFVTGEIDIQALRAFQTNHRSPDKPFKPVPDGFEYNRKSLPLGNTHE